MCCSCIFGAMPSCNSYSPLLWSVLHKVSQHSMASLWFWFTIIPSYYNITCKLGVDEGKTAEVSNQKQTTSSQFSGTSQHTHTWLITSRLTRGAGWPNALCKASLYFLSTRLGSWVDNSWDNTSHVTLICSLYQYKDILYSEVTPSNHLTEHKLN